jgi:hypothetical protein
MQPDYLNNNYLPSNFHMDPRRCESFYPAAAGGGGVRFCVYEITTTPALGSPTTAKVTLYDADDESTVLDTDIDWVGNLEMFDDHIIGDRGTCVVIGTIAYAVTAPCSVSGGGGGGSTVHIGTSPPVSTSSLWIDTSGL